MDVFYTGADRLKGVSVMCLAGTNAWVLPILLGSVSREAANIAFEAMLRG